MRRAYDPRDPLQKPDDPSTWLPTENEALTKAAMDPDPKSDDYWRGIAILADLIDEDAAAKP